MAISLPLDKMTVVEKLRTMESIWDDLCREDANVTSPDWHKQVLQERADTVSSGEESFVDWDTAKRKLRDELE